MYIGYVRTPYWEVNLWLSALQRPAAPHPMPRSSPVPCLMMRRLVSGLFVIPGSSRAVKSQTRSLGPSLSRSLL